MVLEKTEKLLEIESQVRGQLKKTISEIMKEIEFEFNKLRSEEKINIELLYDKYDELLFELKAEEVLVKWRLSKSSDRKIMWQRIKFLLQNSIYSKEYEDLSKKNILNEKEREEIKRMVIYMRDAYGILRFILTRL
ncbi:MAG: hypothetical protein ACO2O4_00865 [Minisyncoccia bacterium]|jgi:hypothetical protein